MVFIYLSNWRDLNPHHNFGRVICYHYTTITRVPPQWLTRCFAVLLVFFLEARDGWSGPYRRSLTWSSPSGSWWSRTTRVNWQRIYSAPRYYLRYNDPNRNKIHSKGLNLFNYFSLNNLDPPKLLYVSLGRQRDLNPQPSHYKWDALPLRYDGIYAATCPLHQYITLVLWI